MFSTELRIATRNSPLALWQANHVARALCQLKADVKVTLVSTATYADRSIDTPISELGGKGAFSKEVQQLVLAGEADLAVHSAKDLQAVTPEGLVIAAFPERGDVRDVLVGAKLSELGPGSRVGSGSNRRRALLADSVDGLIFADLRGNIATRLVKSIEFDAIVMAAAAVERLGLELPVVDYLAPSCFVPQVGQGALAVEVRDPGSASQRDRTIAALVAEINHGPTAMAVIEERHFLAELGGDCMLPAGAWAICNRDRTITINGVLADEHYGHLQRRTVTGGVAEEVGRTLARRLRKALEASVG